MFAVNIKEYNYDKRSVYEQELNIPTMLSRLVLNAVISENRCYRLSTKNCCVNGGDIVNK
jgi:hypothetical protein